MPMPDSGSDWPPKTLEKVHIDIARWSAWWGGDPDQLSQVYGGYNGGYSGHSGVSAEHSFAARGGLLGAVSRFFWGESSPSEIKPKLHVPVASEIAQVSADLVFGQPPTVLVDDLDTQLRIDDLLSDRAATQLHEGAEACSALGHTYLRVGWDRDIDPDGPLLSVVDADAAYPTYSYGHLRECLFVREWAEAAAVLRHMELHERGMVWHAAFLGDHRNLGRMVPLDAHPETWGVVVDGMVSDDRRTGSGVETGIDVLDVVGVSNQRSKTWRHLPAARDLGAADISGVEGSLDALDSCWNSWMRDIRLGQARIHVPKHMLDNRGGNFNLNREIYVGLDCPPDGDLQLEMTQFAIRQVEHAATATALLERIVGGAGYSLQTFGLDPSTSTQTATESWARQNRTQNTRNGKLRHWNRALLDLTKILLAVDNAQFDGTNNLDADVTVQFADTVSDSQLTRAQTAQLLRAAEAASTRTLVELVHNDWDGEQIDEEVALIEGEVETATPVAGDGVVTPDVGTGTAPAIGSVSGPSAPGGGTGLR